MALIQVRGRHGKIHRREASEQAAVRERGRSWEGGVKGISRTGAVCPHYQDQTERQLEQSIQGGRVGGEGMAA